MKSVTSILEKVKEQICDEYCKYREKYDADQKDKDDDFAFDKFMIEYCDKCPLDRL